MTFMTFAAAFKWVTQDYEEVSIEVEFELSEDEEILSLKFEAEDDTALNEFNAAYLASPTLQDRVDGVCLEHALGQRSLN